MLERICPKPGRPYTANNATIALGPAGDVVAVVDQASGTVHFVIDVTGHFQ